MTTLSACRWNWCTRTFSDHSALKEHVELDHVATATPVKRSDVPLLKLVENGASLPESDFTNLLVSFTDSSSSQAQRLPPNYVQRGIMTDPTEFPVPDIPRPGPAAEISPVQSPQPSNQLLMSFSELRGTPSPTPSPIPPSPGTAYLVEKVTQNNFLPVSQRRIPHASPRALHHRRNTSPESPPSTPKSPNSVSRPTVLILPETDHTSPRNTNAADSLHNMDIDSVLVSGLNSQWQPQSQLPLHDSFETSSLPSTVNPSQLHADNMEET